MLPGPSTLSVVEGGMPLHNEDDDCTRKLARKQREAAQARAAKANEAPARLIAQGNLRRGKDEEQQEHTPTCESVEGTYREARSRTGATNHIVSVINQSVCDITISYGGGVFSGTVQGAHVNVDGWTSQGRIHNVFNIHWDNGAYWNFAPSDDFMRCEDTDEDTGEPVSLNEHEVQYARCPPGRYLNMQSVSDQRLRFRRFQKALCTSKKRGHVSSNSTHGQFYGKRGYMTFESLLYPKRKDCPVQRHTAKGGAEPPPYKVDTVALPTIGGNNRLVHDHYGIEYRKVWKAASSAMPRYLRCEYGGDWKKVAPSEPSSVQYRRFGLVRQPIDRWVSGVGEILERIVNGFCIDHPCSEKDGITAKTLQRVRSSSSWYQYFDNTNFAAPDLYSLVKAMIHDTSCNLRFYASEHLDTQALFLAANPGHADELDHIIKLEDVDEGFNALAFAANHTRNEACDFTPQNTRVCKPNPGNLPEASAIHAMLEKFGHLMRDLCLIYAQDFICFEYELPHACKDMF